MAIFNTKTLVTIEVVKHSMEKSFMVENEYNCAVILNGQYTRIFGIESEYPVIKMNVGNHESFKAKRLGIKLSKLVIAFVNKNTVNFK